ncbi:MAG: hypothetical protein ACRDTM_10475 [Micromonosporaceae bacterium]
MTQPPDYPGQPPYGSDPYGEPRYGGDPYRQPGTGRGGGYSDPYRGGYNDPPPNPHYNPPPSPRHGRPDTPGYGPPTGPSYASPDHARPGHARPGHARPNYPEPEDATAEFTAPNYARPDHARPEYASHNYASHNYGPPTGPSYRGPEAPPPRRGRALWLGIVGVLIVSMLALGVVAALVLGDRSDGPAGTTSPSVDPVFSDPAKVVDRWLNAMFILKDPEEMIRYTCKREADRTEVDDAIKRVKKAEQDAKDAKLTMKVTWSKPTEASKDDSAAKVKATLKVIVGDKTEQKPASFDLVYEAGWKVCDTEMQ